MTMTGQKVGSPTKNASSAWQRFSPALLTVHLGWRWWWLWTPFWWSSLCNQIMMLMIMIRIMMKSMMTMRMRQSTEWIQMIFMMKSTPMKESLMTMRNIYSMYLCFNYSAFPDNLHSVPPVIIIIIIIIFNKTFIVIIIMMIIMITRYRRAQPQP